MSVELGSRSWNQMFARYVESDTGDEITSILNQVGDDRTITFSGGYPHPATFPRNALAGNFARVLANPAALQYGPTAGLSGLRDWLSGWLDRHEGLRPADDELVITSGGMEGLGLITKCLLDARDRLLVEGPTFMGALAGFQRAMASVEAVPMDGDGLDVDALERAVLRSAANPPKLVYVIPDYQNPTGVSMSVERRHALVALARRHGMLIVEDVAYRELGFDDERRPSLWSLAPDVVAQAGTFSKTFTPGMRLGWIAAPSPLVAQLVRAKQNTDQCASALGQLLLEDYGRSGGFDRGIAASRAFYGKRCQIMMAALSAHLPDKVTFTRPRGGFFSWLTVPESVNTVELQDRALAEGVTYVPGTAFFPDDRGTSELRLAFSRVADEKIPEGVRRLGAIIADAG
jgi:2-aminoadipate transaminase